MYLTQRQVATMDKEALMAFLSRGIPEGHHIDYKQALSGESRSKQFSECLKDATAFANANGGDILIGVKEPDDKSPPEGLIVGLEHGEELAHDLERLASGGPIDPRISGLLVQPVRIDSEKWVIVVHIPPSMAKPHLVVYEKHTFLHQRHSESVQPMTSYDIRQAVLASATAEDRAGRYAETQRTRLLATLGSAAPCFVLQATPLIPAHPSLNLHDKSVIEALRGSNRNSRHGDYARGLGSMLYPRPTVEGIRGTDSREGPQWITEVHRLGYIGVVFSLADYDRIGSKPEGPYCIREYHQHIFRAFGELCEEVVAATDFDPPFVVDCFFRRARDTCYAMSQGSRSDMCDRDEIIWPVEIRQPGQPFAEVMDEFVRVLHYAYGLNKKEISPQ